MTEYLIVTCDNVLSYPLALTPWNPENGATPVLGVLAEAQRFSDPASAMTQLLAVQQEMMNNPVWNRNVPGLAIVTDEEVASMIRISTRMVGLLMNRGVN